MPRAAEQVGFLQHLQRLNVALTRAQHGLFLVGDSHTLAASPARPGAGAAAGAAGAGIAGTAAGAAASAVVIRSSCAGKDVNSDSAHVAADLAALVADARDRGHWCSWEEAIQE